MNQPYVVGWPKDQGQTSLLDLGWNPVFIIVNVTITLSNWTVVSGFQYLDPIDATKGLDQY